MGADSQGSLSHLLAGATMSGSAYLLRRAARDLREQATTMSEKAHTQRRFLPDGAQGILIGVQVAADWLEHRADEQRAAERQHEKRG